MNSFSFLLLLIFTSVSWIIFIYSANFYYLLIKSFNSKELRKKELEAYPILTIQLPLYNERYVARRLIDSICSLDYPKDRLEIQVLDDSTDITKDICKEAVEEYRKKGYEIYYIHREKRKGFKAGALREGLKKAKGDFIAIFDADFIPPKGFLKDILRYFNDEKIGMIQARWGYVNENYSSLTRAQALDLDLHFFVEQKARSSSELFMNFNGTAGVWRRKCIEEAGGWEDNLTEDLDLSFRAQLKGWKLAFVSSIVCNSELPVQINASKRQRYRWAFGSIQCSIKFLDRIIFSPLPLITKFQALLQLTRHMIYPLLILQFLLLPFLMKLGFSLNSLGALISSLLLGPLIYIITIRKIWKDEWLKKLPAYFFLLLLGGGMALINTKAIIEALIFRKASFLRTPKFGDGALSYWKNRSYVLPFTHTAFLELLLALYGILAFFIAIITRNFFFLPYITLMSLGFFYVAFLTFLHSKND
ncbi:MAG: glycosyltransferase [Nitrososphaerales archaeon]